jgi:3-deoxy-D-manno-octulosonate 8-phosphate phosphatase (KDO 8-P phosphatase)
LSNDEVTQRARGVRLAIFDVDGVMTDGTVFIGPRGEALKAFNILDGHGVKMLQAAGIGTAIISGRTSRMVALRAKELAIRHVKQGAKDKLAEFEKLIARLGVAAQACAFMGDDLVDLPVMRRCGFAVSVPNGAEAVRSAAHYVTRAGGGRGAVREFCEVVLRAQGRLESAQAKTPA